MPNSTRPPSIVGPGGAPLSRPSGISAVTEHEREPQTSARGQPAADKIRDDAKELVQEKQKRELDRRVAELIEVQEHQHAQRAVGQRERPVRRSNSGIVPNADR